MAMTGRSASDRPVIGVLLDERLNPSADGDFSKRPYQALRFDYGDWIAARGGIPVALPYAAGCEADFTALCDGILLTGSDYRFEPDWYVDKGASLDFEPSRRRAYEAELTRVIDAAGLPVLGVCGGMQVMACVRGAKLFPDLRKMEGLVRHWAADGVIPSHAINVTPGSLLARLVGAGERNVNSAHREAVTDCPASVAVTAVAPDGIIEAIEWPDRAYALGVQWHPELSTEDEADPILDSFLEAARDWRSRK